MQVGTIFPLCLKVNFKTLTKSIIISRVAISDTDIGIFKAFVILWFLCFSVLNQLHLWKWYAIPYYNLSRGEIHSSLIAVNELQIIWALNKGRNL